MATLNCDIKYRGFITARGLRFIALIAMTLSQFSLLFSAIAKIYNYLDPTLLEAVPTSLIEVFTTLGHLTFPLLLIASFSTIFAKPESIIRALISNFVLAFITFIFCAFFLYDYINNFIINVPEILFEMMDTDKLIDIIANNPNILNLLGLNNLGTELITPEVLSMVTGYLKTVDLPTLLTEYIPTISGNLSKYILIHYVNINVFWDLTLCTTFYFFLSYQPKKLNAGKLFLFRCCAVLPAIYVLLSTFIYGLLKTNYMDLPIWAIALLTNRPLVAYILFFLIVLLLKYKEAVYTAHNKASHESFLKTLKTNRTSLQFSIYLCVCIAVLSLIDYTFSLNAALRNWGLGTSYQMYLAIPIIMLFSYSKRPKHKWPEVFIPIYYVVNYTVLFLTISGLIILIPDILEMLVNIVQ